MKDFSVAFMPNSNKLVLRIFMNVENNRGELGIEDHLLFEKKISVPINVWNLIVELDEK